jgi:hypothetical protein
MERGPRAIAARVMDRIDGRRVPDTDDLFREWIRLDLRKE